MNTRVRACLGLGIATTLVLGGAVAASAHGWVGAQGSDVIARAAMPGNTDLGQVQYEPQSIEGTKGFTLDPSTGGPADGQLASAGNWVALNLDEQSPQRWVENVVSQGQTINIAWTYTAPHRSAEWRYYLTKQGWDQYSPLTRSELELVETVGWDNTMPYEGGFQPVTLPADRTGDHVLLAVWDVGDNTNAFYNAIDLRIEPDSTAPQGKPVAPAPAPAPTWTKPAPAKPVEPAPPVASESPSGPVDVPFAPAVEVPWHADNGSTPPVPSGSPRPNAVTPAPGGTAASPAGASPAEMDESASAENDESDAAGDVGGATADASLIDPLVMSRTDAAGAAATPAVAVRATRGGSPVVALPDGRLVWALAEDATSGTAEYRVLRAVWGAPMREVARVTGPRYVDARRSLDRPYVYRVIGVDSDGAVTSQSRAIVVWPRTGR